MSSEEDVTLDSYGLLQKSKRSRRVDAGEPRNSYSSIPNFSSRPNLLNSGIYGAFFAAQNQHFASPGAYFNQGFGPKMLNELLSRRVKTINDNTDPMMAIDIAPNDISNLSNPAYECLANQSSIHRAPSVLNGGSGSPPVADMAQHMLRNILQGVGRNKKELFALEQELKGATNEINNECNKEPNSINNNNINNNTANINNNNNNNELKGMNLSIEENGCNDEQTEQCKNLKENLTNGDTENMDNGKPEQRNDRSEERDEVSPTTINEKSRENESSESERSFLSPQSSNKDDIEDTNPKTGQVELKRARVETIVSSMISSPLPTSVNGCKKRKLYHPQQHDNGIAERFTLNDMADVLSDYEDENLSPADVREKVVEKKALESKLKIMQEQLAEMQQKYVQLYTKRDPESIGTAEQESSDIDQEDENSIPSPSKQNSLTPTPTPTPTPIPTPTPVSKELATFPTSSASTSQPAMSPAINKMLSSKFLSQSNNMSHMNLPSFHLHQNFNGALSFLQHQMLQEQQHVQNHLQPHHHGHHHPSHPHPALSNAAAMYLGASQKLFMEQEVRMAKEAALAAEHQQQPSHQINHSQNSLQPPQLPLQPPPQPQQHSHSTKTESGSPTRQSESTAKMQSNKFSHSMGQHGKNEFSDRLQMLNFNAANNQDSFDPEGLAVALKTEIRTSMTNLMNLIDRFMHTKRYAGRSTETTAAEQLNKDLLLASQLLDRKSPRTKVIDRGNCGSLEKSGSHPLNNTHSSTKNSHSLANNLSHSQNYGNSNPENNINAMNLPSTRPGLNLSLFPPSKMNSNSMNNSAAAALYTSMNSHINPFCLPDMRPDGNMPEQNEALSLVVAPKKKRHKVTDTRITPRTVNRILAQDGISCPPPNLIDSPNKFSSMIPTTNGSPESPPPRQFHVPPTVPMLPVSLPTSVAIPNPGLHESQVFSPYSPFYGQHQAPQHLQSSSPPGLGNHLRDSPPLHHSSLFHPAVLAAAQQQQQHHQRVSSPPDYMRSSSALGAGDDRGSECTSMEYDGMTSTISFDILDNQNHSSTLSPMHLRKAKLMFFWVRYPSSAVLKMYFPDIKFNKNNTAQLVKWFSNFREFYYIQMEKYARAAMAEGTKSSDELHVSADCELYRILNLHYNRNNHIEVPPTFKYVVEQTLKEFFKAIQGGKDQEQSWKKSIYKVISRLDDPVPEYFKTPNFLEQLE